MPGWCALPEWRMENDFEHLLASKPGPINEQWAHEPEFKSRLASADKWMRHYIATYPDQEGSNWMIFHNVFQCEVHELGTVEVGKIVDTLKKIKPMDWDGLLDDGDLDCKELAGETEKYTLRLSESHRAIVGRDGRRLLLLVLCAGRINKDRSPT